MSAVFPDVKWEQTSCSDEGTGRDSSWLQKKGAWPWPMWDARLVPPVYRSKTFERPVRPVRSASVLIASVVSLSIESDAWMGDDLSLLR